MASNIEPGAGVLILDAIDASVALDDCRKGKTATAIPVLEKKLREGGFSLPKVSIAEE